MYSVAGAHYVFRHTCGIDRSIEKNNEGRDMYFSSFTIVLSTHTLVIHHSRLLVTQPVTLRSELSSTHQGSEATTPRVTSRTYFLLGEH